MSQSLPNQPSNERNPRSPRSDAPGAGPSLDAASREERIFDAGIEEILGLAAPGVTASSIYSECLQRAALKSDRADSEKAKSDKAESAKESALFSNDELENAVALARRYVRSSSPIGSGAGGSGAVGRSDDRRARSALLGALAIAATLIGITFAGWWLLGPVSKQTPVAVAKRTADAITTKDSTGTSRELNPPAEATVTHRIEGVSSATAPTRADAIEDVANEVGKGPSERVESNSQRTAISDAIDGEKKKTRTRFAPGGQGDQEVVSVINHQFETIWKEAVGLDVGAPQSVSLNPERAARFLVARDPTTAELEAIRREKLTSQGMLEASLERWLLSDEFARVWAKRLSRFYLGDTEPTAADAEAADRFESWLRVCVHEDISLEDIQRDVLSALGNPEHPAFYITQHWSRFSVSMEPSAGQWVGLNGKETRSLIGATQFFLKATDHAMIGCTQCHSRTKDSPVAWMDDAFKASGEMDVGPSVAFDSFAAVLVSAINAKRTELFRPDDNERITKVVALTPDGRKLPSDESFSKRIDAMLARGAGSPRALVNSLWSDFFGQALVATGGAGDSFVEKGRAELASYLADQVLKQQSSVRQVVYWLLMSAPSLQPEESFSYTQFLAADPLSLQRLVARRRTFLSLVLGQPQASNASVRLSLSEFASRMIPESTGLQDRGLLAQPSSVQSPAAKPSKDTKALKEGADREWFATEQRAELDYRVPTKGALDWSDRLSGSDLDANGIIEHVYYLTKQRGPTEEEMRAWQASRWESLDRKLGILRLLSAVANYDN